jgi:hypothetical protein
MDLSTALADVGAFLKKVRFSEDATSYFDAEEGAYDTGKLILAEPDRSEHDYCLQRLVQVFETTTLFNRASLQELLQETLKKASREATSTGQLPGSTIKDAVVWLRNALTSLNAYTVYLPVLGVDLRTLPCTVGNLAFFSGDSADTSAVMEAVCANIRSWKNEDAEKERYIELLKQSVQTWLGDKAIVAVEVQAGNAKSAEEKAIAICRQGIDVINFFSDLLVGVRMRACVSLDGEGYDVTNRLASQFGVKLLISMRQKNEGDLGAIRFKDKEIAETHCSKGAAGPLVGVPLPKFVAGGLEGTVHKVFSNVTKLVGKDGLSTLEDRVLTAFQWAGRATVAVRREEAFLLYMISLESLILSKAGKAGKVVDQFTKKAAHLLQRTSGDRKRLMKRLEGLYDIRSEIVHSGRFQVSEFDLDHAREFAKKALFIVSNDTTFQQMTEATHLDDWLTERMNSRADDTAVSDDGDTAGPNVVGETC